MKKIKMYELEQSIMNCWNVVDDIEILYKSICDSSDFKNMPSERTDKIANVLLGLKELYRMKFERCFEDYEQVCREYLKHE